MENMDPLFVITIIIHASLPLIGSIVIPIEDWRLVLKPSVTF